MYRFSYTTSCILSAALCFTLMIIDMHSKNKHFPKVLCLTLVQIRIPIQTILEKDRTTSALLLVQQNLINRGNVFLSYTSGQTYIPKCNTLALFSWSERN